MKKFLSIILTFCIMCSVTLTFAYSPVEDLGIMTGDEGGLRLEDNITRAEFTKMAMVASGLTTIAVTDTQFTDVDNAHWASGYIAAAASRGIVKGFENNTFGPEDNILFQDVITIVTRLLGYEPLAAANGGYPTGYEVAANKSGILNGVTGINNTPATRGQVKDIFNNALNAPLMERRAYGKDEEYVIYDGKSNTNFKSILTEIYNMKKFNGIITGNRYTTLEDSAGSIDNNEKERIQIDFDLDTDYDNYNLSEIEGTAIYNGTSAATTMVGKKVSGIIKKNNNEQYEIVSVEEKNNKELSINFTDFDKYEGNKIYYFKNPDDRTTTTVKLDTDYSLLFNGIANCNEDIFDTITDTHYSGAVNLIDNDNDSIYDIVDVVTPAIGVVKSVSARGKITLKTMAKNIAGDRISSIDTTEADDTIVNFINGDVKDLKEWDVLAIYYNSALAKYDIKVLNSQAIQGRIATKIASDKSADGYSYKINGNEYNVSENAYNSVESGWKPGDSGTFYIDEYGKIVAYNKESAGAAISDMGYVLETAIDNDTWGNTTLKLKILTAANKVEKYDVASTITIDNSTYFENDTYKTKDINLDKLGNELTNSFITYGINSSKAVSSIEFATNNEDDSFYISYVGTIVDYDTDAYDLKFGNRTYTVDNSAIFFIKGNDNVEYQGTTIASDTMSKVGNYKSIGKVNGCTAYVFNDGDAIVIFNTTGGIAANTNVAVIDSVGQTIKDGSKVKDVTYYMNGQKQSATVSEDIDASALVKAERGDIYKFNVTNGIINEIELVAAINNKDRKDFNGALNADAAIGVTNNGKLKVVNDLSNINDYKTLKITDNTNFYVYDNNKLAIGELDDINYYDDIISEYQKYNFMSIDFIDDNFIVADGEIAHCAFDYIIYNEYDGEITDVIIFKAKELGRYKF